MLAGPPGSGKRYGTRKRRRGTLAVVYLEAEDVGAAMQAIGTSEAPFDRWFRDTMEQVHGIDLAQSAPRLGGRADDLCERSGHARPGRFVRAPTPGGTVHGFRVESEQARYLILTTPRTGEFCRAITLASRPGGLPPLESVEGSRIKRASRDYGVEFIGPLPDPPD
jgi:hypothetical protein